MIVVLLGLDPDVDHGFREVHKFEELFGAFVLNVACD